MTSGRSAGFAILTILMLATGFIPVVAPRAGPSAHVAVPSPGLRAFAENDGQVANDAVRFYEAFGRMTVGFSTSSILFDLAAPSGDAGSLVRVSFAGARAVVPQGQDETATRLNYYWGLDPARWHTGTRSFRTVAYESLYPGIDLVYRATDRGPKYEFRVARGADPASIRLVYEGVRSLDVAVDRTVSAVTAAGTLRDSAPEASQDGIAVACRFALRGPSALGVDCPDRDAARPLTIDPLVYATYLGGTDVDEAHALVVDAAGNAHVAGSTRSVDFPTTPGAYNRTTAGGSDVFVAELDPTGGSLLYATYLGGSGDDSALALAVDAGGNAYVTGSTASADFPTTPGAWDRINNMTDAFVAKVTPNGGALAYATFLGGGSYDVGYGVQVDAGGTAYVAGQTGSPDFPTTPGALSRTYGGGFLDGFAVALNPGGTALAYGTFLGGVDVDAPWGLAVDGGGDAFVVGTTLSPNFPVTAGAFRTALSGISDAFALKLNPAGTGLVYGTFLGGSGQDTASAVAVDAAGNAYVPGGTWSADFPVSPGAYSTTYQALQDGFVAKLTAGGNALAYATFLGGPREDMVTAVAIDGVGRATVTGYTASDPFPVTPGAMNATYRGGIYDAFLTRLNATGTGLSYSTYLGGAAQDRGFGVAFDGRGNAYVGGATDSANFPVTPGAYNTTYAGAGDAFVAKVSLAYPITVDASPSGLLLDVDATLHSTPYAFDCEPGTTHALNAPSQTFGATQYAFQSWSDGGAQSHAITCTMPDAFLATFVATAHQVTVTSVPSALQVTVDATGYAAPHTFWCPVGTGHSIGTSSPQGGGPTRYVFAAWSDSGALTHGIVCNSPATYTAFFTTEHQITVDTAPSNRQVRVDAVLLMAPQTYWWAAGSTHVLDAPSPQVVGPTRDVFVSWSDGGAQSHSIAVSGPQAYVASFATEYQVTIDTIPGALEVLVDGLPQTAPDTFWCGAGNPHVLDVATPQAGTPGTRYSFASWSDGGGQNHVITCTNPLTVTAAFSTEFQITVATLPANLGASYDGVPFTAPQSFWCGSGTVHGLDTTSPQGAGSVRNVFQTWSDGGVQAHPIACAGAVTYTAVFETQYRVIVDTAPPGQGQIVSVDGANVTGPTTFWWPLGTVHSLTVPTDQPIAADARYHFASWSDAGVQNRSYVVTSAATITATFVLEYRFLFGTTPPGLSVRVDGVTYATPATVWLTAAAHGVAVPSPQPGPPGTRFAFATWSDGGAPAHTVNVTGPMSMTVTFLTQFRIAVTSPYGTPFCDATDCWYDAGQTAILQIEGLVAGPPDVQYRFRRWAGNVTAANPSIPVLMDGPKVETVEWITEYFLYVVSPYGNATASRWYEAGQTAQFSVSVTQTVVDGKTYRFVRWTGNVTSTDANGAVLMDGPKQVVATWEELTFVEAVVGWLWWLIPLLVALALVAAAVGRRRRKRKHAEELDRMLAVAERPALPPPAVKPIPKPEPEDTAVDEALADLEEELDLDGGPER